MKLKVKLLRDGARLPKRAYPTDAGADVFYCHSPNIKDRALYRPGFDGECHVAPNSSCIMPTGIKVEVPEGYMLEVKNKSGMASKRGLVVGACVIDSGYDGEVFINLHNIGAASQKIDPGEKLAQVVLIPIETCDFVEAVGGINVRTERGAGGFGSTGRK